MATNLQTFSGEVEIPEGNLQLKRILELSGNNASTSNTGILFSRNLGSTSNSNVIVYFDEATESLRFGHTLNASSDSEIIMDSANVLNVNVFGEVEASYFKGDGGLLSNLVTDLQSVTENGAETDQTLVLTNAVTGIDVQTGNVNVAGNVTASIFFGDGGLLSNITQTLQGITEIGNTTSIALEFNNVTTGFVTTSNVGIVNTSPQHNFSVGSNLYVHDTDSNVLTVEGNVSAHKLTLGTIEITPAYGLENVTNISNLAHATLLFQNTTTAFVTTAMAGIGLEPDSSDVGASGLHVDGHLRLGGPAGTDENSDIYLRTAGQLNIESNDTDTDNQYTALALRAGNANESNIVVEGALSDTSKQYISFGVRNQERMKIDREGNVTVGYASTSHKLDVAGSANVTTLNASNLVINTVSISVQYDLDQTLENGNVSTNVITVGKVSVTDPTLAQTASNLVTWNATTKEFEDSGGLISNKLAIVSEQPPSALTANSTTVTDHGVYKLTTSGLASNSNTWNAFNGDASDAWTSVSTYTGTDNAYGGSVQLSTVSSTGSGEWLAVEFPYKTTLRHMKLTPAAVASYPGTANLYATNDSTSWTLLKEWSDVVPGSASEVQTVVVDSAASYKKYAIVPTKAAGASTSVAIAQWQLFAESFAVDGGKVALAAAAITGGNTVVDQTGPHARASPPLRKYPEIVFTQGVFEGNDSTWTYTQGGYTVSATSQFNAGHAVWKVFNNSNEPDGGTGWATSTSADLYDGTTGVATGNSTLFDGNRGEYVDLKLPHKIKVSSFSIYSRDTHYSPNDHPKSGYLYGSNDGSTWIQITSYSGLTYQSSNLGSETVSVNATEYYDHLRLTTTARVAGDGNTWVDIGELEYYGYEETSDPDTSVDTTITSQFNLPDTTGVKLYIDGDKGSTPTDYSGEGHTLTDNSESFSGNAWSFSSLATSNVTMTSGDFAMEGTHPHSVSLWFNCANVTSNATLFHVGTEAGEGDAKTAISLTETGHLGWIDGGDNQFVTSNTWHNLVYATQGGGGLRTCYLDGRKLGDVSDQDTFGDYPPFAMSTFSEYGYTVSTGDPPHDQNQFVWKAFDSNVSTFWYSHPGSSDADSTYFDGNPRGNDGQSITDSDGTTHTGSWGKIEFPHKFVLNYLEVQGGTPVSAYYPHNPNNYVILGSNDDETWDLLSTRTGASPTTDGMTSGGTQIDTHTVNAQKAYKYIIFLVTQISTVLSGGREFIIASLRLYGHKENDTTRFPISSTVLKYPHIAMTGPAQRGYVASASNTNIGAERYPWKLFDDSTDTQWQMSDTNNSSSEGYDLTSPYDANNNSPTITDNNGNDHTGAWVKLQLPVAINISSMYIHAKSTNRRPDSAVLLGSNDDSTWYVIKDTFTIANQDKNTISISTSSYYKYVMFLVKSLTGGEGQLQINLINYYGTEEDLDIVARVGEGLDGKVANFRVYDKYLHEEQALELWDAQKDQFGVATSSVVVHKGRLGVGTTEPEGRFAVLDEPGDVGEFPPRAMTAAETYMDGHGVFRASASYTEPDTNFGPPAPWKAFSKDTESQTTGWSGSNDHNAVTGSNPGEYNGTNQLASSTPLGEWLKIELPHKIKLNSYALKPLGIANRYGVADYPKTFYIYGSNDGSSWELIDSRVNTSKTPQILGAAVASNETITYSISNNGLAYYDKYAIVITKINSEAVYAVDNTVAATYLAIGEWRLFGTRQGQSILHDGELKLTKNLTVPRIGPPLDADDTPRRDKLVVEYNTSTNPTDNGVVRDTSGGGRDGLIRGSASYDATEKAFDIVASSDIITTGTNIGGVSGDFLTSVSLWFKPSTVTSATSQILFIHTSAYAIATSFLVNIYEDQISVGHGGTNNSYNDGSIVANEWYHVVAIKKGTGAVSNNIYEIYLNGTKLTLTNGAGADAMNVSSDQAIIIGGASKVAVNTEQFVGKISNVKYYPGIVLTADEVKRLYDMGRLGNVIAQPVHIAAPLYAPGTIVQVESSTKTDTSSTTSITEVDISGLSVSIRPKFHNSKILVSYRVNAQTGNGHCFLRVKRTQGGSSTYIGDGDTAGNRPICTSYIFGNNSEFLECYSFEYLDDADGTEPITYQLQMKVTSTTYTLYVNRSATDTDDLYHGRTSSSITVKEVCQ
jgi:hypothetical protein